MDKNRFQKAVEMAVSNPRRVAKRILTSGYYVESDVYIFCQDMYAEVRKISSGAADEFKDALSSEIVLSC